MEPISFVGGVWPYADSSGKIRYCGKTPCGKKMQRSRLNMINFLHAINLPTWAHVHHKNEDTECDEIWNLELLSNSQHMSLHKGPRAFPTDWEYEKNRRLKPEVQEAIRESSLRYYHKHKDEINANPEKQQYKREWYMDNKDAILVNLKNRYDTDEEYRENCKRRAKDNKAKKRLQKKQMEAANETREL